MKFCAPAWRPETVTLTSPLAGMLVTVAITKVPSRKVTVPVGAVAAVPLPGLVTATWALRLRLVPNAELGVEAVRTVVVAALLTVWLTLLDVLDEKLPSPEYSAVRLGEPASRLEVDREATPLLRLTGEPTCVEAL